MYSAVSKLGVLGESGTAGPGLRENSPLIRALEWTWDDRDGSLYVRCDQTALAKFSAAAESHPSFPFTHYADWRMRAGSNWRHLNGLSLGMMGDPVRCLPKVVHPDVAALKLQHNRLKSFSGLDAAGFRHVARTQPLRRDLGRGVPSVVPLADRAIGNLQQWLIGTYHGVSRAQLPVYLDEFVFRHNRRRQPMAAFQTLLGLGTTHRPTPASRIRGARDLQR